MAITESTSSPRGPGRPAILSRDKIIAAARDIGYENLTMEAVANRLGVGRRAIGYHVRDREELVSLLAMDVYRSLVERVELPENATWQEVLRIHAKSLYLCLVQMGPLGAYVQFPGGEVTTGGLDIAETTLRGLTVAGFNETESLQIFATVVRYAASMAAERQLTEKQGGDHPQLTQVTELLSALPEDQLSTMRAAIKGSPPAHDAGVDFGVDLIIDGVEARLAKRKVEMGRKIPNRKGRAR
jgi:AcrR family transcriptional regulator